MLEVVTFQDQALANQHSSSVPSTMPGTRNRRVNKTVDIPGLAGILFLSKSPRANEEHRNSTAFKARKEMVS